MKKKISLKSLKIESFVTEQENKKLNTLKGGTYGYDYDYDQCNGSGSCYPIYSDYCPSAYCTRPVNCD